MAKATQTKGRAVPQADFELPLTDALDQLLKPRHIVAGASWFFSVRDGLLCITREDPVSSTPIDNS